MSEDTTDLNDESGIELEMAVYDEEGDQIGVVDSFTDIGFQVAIHDVGTGDEEPGGDIDQGGSVEEAADAEGGVVHQHEPGQEFGEGFLMWRCDECGEMGEIEEGLPEECPNCGAEKEKLMYWTED